MIDILKQSDLSPNETEMDDLTVIDLAVGPQSKADEILPELVPHSRLDRVWKEMDRFSIPVIIVEFSGWGDSGEIDAVDIRYMGKWLLPHATGPLKKLVKELSDEIIRSDDFPNWYSNEGGYGTMEWILVGKTIEVEVMQAYISFSSISHTYDANGIVVA